MPVSKKKPTTSTSEGSAQQSSSPTLPEQDEFRQHLRHLAVSAVQVLIEQVMREELEQCIGASWGEVTPERRGYRNGSYTRDLVTSTGRIEDLKVPRDREGVFHSQVFERYSRYEPEVAEALTQMFISGTSTHKVGEVAATLMGATPSASSVSRLNQTLAEQYETWRKRPLLAHYRILYLDGIHFSVRHGAQTDSTIILTALSVDLQGNKEVLALRACAEEDKDGWSCLVQDIRTRGATQIDLMVTDPDPLTWTLLPKGYPAASRTRRFLPQNCRGLHADCDDFHRQYSGNQRFPRVRWRFLDVSFRHRTQGAARPRYPGVYRSFSQSHDSAYVCAGARSGDLQNLQWLLVLGAPFARGMYTHALNVFDRRK